MNTSIALINDKTFRMRMSSTINPNGFEARITLAKALEICVKFGLDQVAALSQLQDPSHGFVQCSDKVSVWAETSIN